MDMKYLNLMCVCGRRLALGAGLAVCLLSLRAGGASESEFQDELRFIDALQWMRMPDIAEEVIAEARKRFPEAEFPEAGPQLKVRETQGLLSQGKFAEVQKVVDAMPDKNSAEYWALSLAIANAY